MFHSISMGHMYCGLVWHLIAEGARMKTGRPKPGLVLTADEDGAVAELGESSLDPPASGRMRGMSLLSHVGLSNAAIAEKMVVTRRLRWESGGSGLSSLAL